VADNTALKLPIHGGLDVLREVMTSKIVAADFCFLFFYFFIFFIRQLICKCSHEQHKVKCTSLRSYLASQSGLLTYGFILNDTIVRRMEDTALNYILLVNSR